MKLLLLPVGSSGDMNPFIAVARALHQQGHEPHIAAPPFYEQTVSAAEIPFHPLGPDDPRLESAAVARDNPELFGRLGPIHLFRRWVPLAAEKSVDDLFEAIRRIGPDRIVLHPLAFAGWWASESLGIERVGFILSPSTLLSDDDTSIYPTGGASPDSPRWFRSLSNASAKVVLRVLTDPPLNRIARARALPRIRHAFTEACTTHLPVLAAGWSEAIRPPAGDDPPGLAITGFPFDDRDAHAALEPRLASFIDQCERADGRPLVVAMGSVLSQSLAGVYHAAAEAIRSIGRPAVFVAGDDVLPDAALPPRSIRVPYAPFAALFPRASIILHHGGIGTTAQALRAGVPTLILPQSHDQYDNADRVRRLGTSATLTGRLTPARLERSIRSVLETRDLSAQSEQTANIVRAEDGANAAAIALTRPIASS